MPIDTIREIKKEIYDRFISERDKFISENWCEIDNELRSFVESEDYEYRLKIHGLTERQKEFIIHKLKEQEGDDIYFEERCGFIYLIDKIKMQEVQSLSLNKAIATSKGQTYDIFELPRLNYF